MKILTVVAGLRYQRAYKRPQRLTNANSFEVCHDFLKCCYGFDIVGRTSTHGRKQPLQTCTQNTQPVYDEKKTNTFILPRTCSIGGSKILHKDLSVRLEREFGFDVACMKTSEKMSACLTNPLKS